MSELLAPAGDIRSFDAAIACGADAVYLGLEDFNARMKACNFSTDNLRDYVAKAHFYGVKVYLTVNTILQNAEFSKLIELVKVAICAKIDAFIVQDLGVAYVLKKTFPDIVLHASTQLGVHNLYGAKVAESMGFARVVLSRETKLEDIREIRKNTGLEIECFVQGALCVCFSGNCYMSAAEQAASGNRGLCKQLCRLPYAAQSDGKRQVGYLLSARDMCLADSLAELADAGVCSFKIEGRMRREGYVGEAVSVYRKMLDKLDEGRPYKLNRQELTDLKKVYSRGEYSKRAYLDGGVPNIIEKRFNNHIGVEIGKVASVRPFKDALFEIAISSTHSLKEGDGLKFFDGDRERASLGVGAVTDKGNGTYTFVSKTEVRRGWSVRLIADRALENAISERKRFVPITVRVRAIAGAPFEIAAVASIETSDGVLLNICSTKCGSVALETARNAPVSKDELRAQCSKVADSGFEIASCEVSTDGVFIAKSVVNALRREVFEDLKDKIVAANEEGIAVDFDEKAAGDILGESENRRIAAIEDCKALRLRIVKSEDLSGSFILRRGELAALSPNVYSVDEIRQMLASLELDEADVALQLPVIANGKDLKIVEDVLKAFPKLKTLLSENIYGLYFAKNGYRVLAGAGHNVANIFASNAIKVAGAFAVGASLEYPRALDGCDERLDVVGEEMPLMTLAHCPFKTLYGNDCGRCTYSDGLALAREKRIYGVRRIRLSQCYFQLWSANAGK